MSFRSARIAVALAVISPASCFADSTLAVVARGDGVLNLYRVRGAYPQLTTSIPIGKAPGEMCLDPNHRRIFVSNVGDKNIAVVDLQSRSVVANFADPGIASPDGCVVSPDSKKLYVADQKNDVVFVFSTDSKQLLKKIAVGKEPRRLIFSPDGKRVLVSNAESNNLSVIDPATDAVVNTIKTATEPRSMAFSPDGKTLAVSIVVDDCTSFYDANTLEFKQQIGVGQSPQKVIFSPDGKLLFVMGKLRDEVSVVRIDEKGNRVANWISVSHGDTAVQNSWGMAMSDDGKHLFVTNLGEGIISLIDLQMMKVIGAVQGGKMPMAVLYIE
jgi:YVTN family beta-propeller protein